jgi:hypothetical protein
MFSVIGAIGDKWMNLGGPTSFLGLPLTDETATPDRLGRFNHFQGGSIYWSPATGAHEVHGANRSRWAEIGWERSYLGYPTSDEIPFSEGGRASLFQNGGIYWWPDTGAIDLRGVIVHYTGINCFGDTDELGSDEPYAVMGVVSPGGVRTFRSRVYDNVNGGDSVPDLLEIYNGPPNGITLAAVLMEHDSGDPQAIVNVVQQAAQQGYDQVQGTLIDIPMSAPSWRSSAWRSLTGWSP